LAETVKQDMTRLEQTERSFGKIGGSSPSEDLYYVLLFFDISEPKKYRMLLKTLKRYSFRIQKSVFEAHLKNRQVFDLTDQIRKLMASERWRNPADNVRIYKIYGTCTLTVFGEYQSHELERNIFL
jgi:CRISPR-associated endonuclease Cas2